VKHRWQQFTRDERLAVASFALLIITPFVIVVDSILS
jgi:hypothetical protein